MEVCNKKLLLKDMVFRFFRLSYLNFKALFGYYETKSYFLLKIINSLFQMIFFTFFALYIFDIKDCTFWIIGNAFMLSTCNSLFGVGLNATYERVFGTLKYSVISNLNTLYKYLIQIFMHVLEGTLEILLGIGLGILLFGMKISIGNFIYIIIISIFSMFSACSFCLIIGQLGLLMRDMNLFINIVNMMIMICSGVNYSIENLPRVFQILSKLLPMTRSISAAREVLNYSYKEATLLVIGEVICGIVYMILAVLISKIIEREAIKHATLDLL